MEATQQTSPQPSAGPGGTLAEVWGDVVDVRHLLGAVIIGGALSFATFFVFTKVFAGMVSSAALARAYAMLAGLIGCVASGVICARLYPPKRVISEVATDPAWRLETMDQLAAETGAIGNVAELPQVVIDEMKELDLYDLFATYDPAERLAAGAPHAAKPQSTIG